MLYPALEFFGGLFLASASGSAARAVALATPAALLVKEEIVKESLEKIDLNKARTISVLVHELERRGLKSNSAAEDEVTGLSEIPVPVLHPKLADFAGKWLITAQEEVLLVFFLGREQARLGVGAVGQHFAFISERTGIPAERLMEWFYNIGELDIPNDHFINGELEAYLRYLKEVTVPARMEAKKEEQNG
jgi:hypothetical protein